MKVDPTIQGVQSAQTPPAAAGFWGGSWGYRDIAMCSTQGLTGIGGLVNLVLGGWNTASNTSPVANASNNQPPSITTANSYVLLVCGVLFTGATLIQLASHYRWRLDHQNSKNVNSRSLGDDLEKNLQEFQVIVQKVEAINQQIKVLNPELNKNI